MFKQKLQRGFTLIELLVVIAIIGILAATVLAALGSARQSGADASIQSQVNSTKAQAELFYNNNTANSLSYAGVCAAGTNSLTTLLTALATVSTSTTDAAGKAGAAQSNTTYCNENGTTWVVSQPLNGGGFFCADSTGFSGKRTLLQGNGTFVCSAS